MQSANSNIKKRQLNEISERKRKLNKAKQNKVLCRKFKNKFQHLTSTQTASISRVKSKKKFSFIPSGLALFKRVKWKYKGSFCSTKVEEGSGHHTELKQRSSSTCWVPPLQLLYSFSNLLYGWSASPIRPAQREMKEAVMIMHSVYFCLSFWFFRGGFFQGFLAQAKTTLMTSWGAEAQVWHSSSTRKTLFKCT